MKAGVFRRAPAFHGLYPKSKPPAMRVVLIFGLSRARAACGCLRVDGAQDARGRACAVRGDSGLGVFEGEASWAPVGRLFAAVPRGCWAFFRTSCVDLRHFAGGMSPDLGMFRTM